MPSAHVKSHIAIKISLGQGCAYDRNGEPRRSEGELLVESVYRYKGQSAPAVVVTEFDFAVLDDAARRRLFVALTRAQMAAELVLSVAAERCLAAAMA